MSSSNETPQASEPASLPSSPDGKTDESFSNVLGNETIYEVFGQISGQNRLDSPTSHVVSERVQNLASQIYTELQKIISRCSEDEEVVGGLMPLIVNVLEALDLSIIESQQLQVELELCKDDNEQLVAAFDKEKASKKRIEQKLLEYEFQAEEEKQQFTQKVMSLENIVKMLELKSKNSADHATRLEEKENELKVENSKLHTRYNELLRSHCDLMERTKILMGNDDGPMSLGPPSLSFSANLKPIKKSDIDPYSSQCGESLEVNPPRVLSSSNLIPRQAWVDTDLSLEDASIIEDIDDIPRDRDRNADRDKDTQSITGQSLQPSEHANADNFFGMEKEVQNLIKENDELLATKNALNIVKDDLIAKVDELQSDLTISREEVQQLTAVKDKLKARISSMEKELKETKEQLNEMKQKAAARAEDDQEGLPMGQRKRFTRLEMAKVLKERNQYKEKLIELQEAIRWTQVIRESKAEGEKRSAIWKLGKNLTSFSALFSTSGSTTVNRESQNRSPTKSAAIRYDPSSPAQVAPVFDIIKRKPKNGSGDLVFLSDNDPANKDKSLKNVQAHVNRINGDRIMAYGWSIAGVSSDSPTSNMVPVPIYCRPLSSDDMGMKIWCAAAVDLTGGEAGFPGNNVMSRSESQHRMGSSAGDKKGGKDDDNLNLSEAESDLGIYTESSNFPDPKKLSTFAWICSVSHSRSKVSVVNIKNNPSELLDSFTVRTHLLCIASVPGAKNDDLHGFDLENMSDVKIVQVNEETPSNNGQEQNTRDEVSQSESQEKPKEKTDEKNDSIAKEVISSNEKLEKIMDYVAYTEPPSPSTGGDGSSTTSVYQPLSTCLPTMWLGGQNGVLYVHSGLAQWSHCIFRVKLPDSILQIAHFKGRVFVALANGQCCVFTRSLSTGCWDFSKYVILDLGSINSQLTGNTTPGKTGSSNATSSHSIRCMEVTKTSVWLGYRNMVFVLDCNSLGILHSFSVDPRKETQVRQLTAMEDGVWCSIRLDSTIRLYSACKPYQHIQDVDIEPHVTKLLGTKSFSFVRITSLKASNNRLWIGTASGVILSIPCDRNGPSSGSEKKNSDVNTSIIPKCNSSQAQLSYHGHKDAVKFFVMAKNLIMSGGEGYIDFRVDPEDKPTAGEKADRSHLIVWESNS